LKNKPSVTCTRVLCVFLILFGILSHSNNKNGRTNGSGTLSKETFGVICCAISEMRKEIKKDEFDGYSIVMSKLSE